MSSSASFSVLTFDSRDMLIFYDLCQEHLRHWSSLVRGSEDSDELQQQQQQQQQRQKQQQQRQRQRHGQHLAREDLNQLMLPLLASQKNFRRFNDNGVKLIASGSGSDSGTHIVLEKLLGYTVLVMGRGRYPKLLHVLKMGLQFLQLVCGPDFDYLLDYPAQSRLFPDLLHHWDNFRSQELSVLFEARTNSLLDTALQDRIYGEVRHVLKKMKCLDANMEPHVLFNNNFISAPTRTLVDIGDLWILTVLSRTCNTRCHLLHLRIKQIRLPCVVQQYHLGNGFTLFLVRPDSSSAELCTLIWSLLNFVERLREHIENDTLRLAVSLHDLNTLKQNCRRLSCHVPQDWEWLGQLCEAMSDLHKGGGGGKGQAPSQAQTTAVFYQLRRMSTDLKSLYRRHSFEFYKGGALPQDLQGLLSLHSESWRLELTRGIGQELPLARYPSQNIFQVMQDSPLGWIYLDRGRNSLFSLPRSLPPGDLRLVAGSFHDPSSAWTWQGSVAKNVSRSTKGTHEVTSQLWFEDASGLLQTLDPDKKKQIIAIFQQEFLLGTNYCHQDLTELASHKGFFTKIKMTLHLLISWKKADNPN